MNARTISLSLATASALALFANVAAASGPMGVWGRVASVEQVDATHVRVHGCFLFASTTPPACKGGQGSYQYSCPEVGFFDYACPAGQEALCAMQWKEIAATIGGGPFQCVGWGQFDQPKGTLYSEGATSTSDPYPLGMGVDSVGGSPCAILADKCPAIGTGGAGGSAGAGGTTTAGSGGAKAGSGGTTAGAGGTTAGAGGALAGAGGTTAAGGGTTAGAGGTTTAGSGGTTAGSGGATAGAGGAGSGGTTAAGSGGTMTAGGGGSAGSGVVTAGQGGSAGNAAGAAGAGASDRPSEATPTDEGGGCSVGGSPRELVVPGLALGLAMLLRRRRAR